MKNLGLSLQVKIMNETWEDVEMCTTILLQGEVIEPN